MESPENVKRETPTKTLSLGPWGATLLQKVSLFDGQLVLAVEKNFLKSAEKFLLHALPSGCHLCHDLQDVLTMDPGAWRKRHSRACT